MIYRAAKKFARTTVLTKRGGWAFYLKKVADFFCVGKFSSRLCK